MSNSSNHPRVKLSRLRDIGWKLWDPIGLLPPNVNWTDEECHSYSDEYDTYLLGAAGKLRNGASQESVVAYLTEIEEDHMGLGHSPGAGDRLKAVVAAIAADDELWTWPDEHGRFQDQEFP